MSIITDGLLVATCLTAALYCIVLSRRLSRFSDTESGIGKQISQLNAILDETRTTTKESHAGAKSVSDRLSRDLSGAKKAIQDLSALIERAEATLDREFESRGKTVQVRDDNSEVSDLPDRANETDIQKPPQNPPEPETEAEHDDTGQILDSAERDFDLADARGEPQLGFLPNVTDTSSISDLTLDDEKDEPTSNSGKNPSGDAENLLKVERMAL